MRTTRRTTARRAAVVGATAAALLVTAAVAPSASATEDTRGGGKDDRRGGYGQGYGLNTMGLTDGGKGLVYFRTDAPNRARHSTTIQGLSGDTFLVGIDFRVQNGALYGVGNSGGVYSIDHRNAEATRQGQLSVALDGTFFGVDFNPAANALRITSDRGQNLRQPFAATGDATTGATVTDTSLTNPAAPPATDRPTATGISGSAYTNNDLDARTSTTLFALDASLDQLDLQSPANAGLLAATGKLGVDARPDAGFDIYSTVRGGRTVAVEGYAVVDAGKGYRAYQVNLFTGELTDLGKFPTPVTDLAIGLDQR